MNYVELNNGIKMPNIGIGTFMIGPEDAENSVIAACLKLVNDDIKEYQKWREENNKVIEK